MCHFVEQYQQEVVGVEVAVDAYLVVRPLWLWPAVVAQLGVPLACDVQVHLVFIHKVENGIHRARWQIYAKCFFIQVNIGLFHRLKEWGQGRTGQRWGSRNGGVCGAWACGHPCRCRPQRRPAATG